MSEKFDAQKESRRVVTQWGQPNKNEYTDKGTKANGETKKENERR